MSYYKRLPWWKVKTIHADEWPLGPKRIRYQNRWYRIHQYNYSTMTYWLCSWRDVCAFPVTEEQIHLDAILSMVGHAALAASWTSGEIYAERA